MAAAPKPRSSTARFRIYGPPALCPYSTGSRSFLQQLVPELIDRHASQPFRFVQIAPSFVEFHFVSSRRLFNDAIFSRAHLVQALRNSLQCPSLDPVCGGPADRTRSVIAGAGFSAGNGVTGSLGLVGGSGGTAAVFSAGGAGAFTRFPGRSLSCTRRCFRPLCGRLTMAGCQSGGPCAIVQFPPAKRYLVRAALNWFSCSSFSPCCAVISFGGSPGHPIRRSGPARPDKTASSAGSSRFSSWNAGCG